MRIMISYFYQVRNMPSFMIPVSAACGDPVWYHHGTRDKEIQGYDKSGIWLGIRYTDLSPHFLSCDCPCEYHKKRTKNCSFLLDYKAYLDTLDFNKILSDFRRLEEWASATLKIDNPTIVLLVHEAPTNPCSEREPLVQWFKEHDYELKEFLNFI